MVDLGPTGKAGLDEMPDIVIRDLLLVCLDEGGQFRARAYERLISFDDAPQLRQFVYAR
jgi:hypothetical protein